MPCIASASSGSGSGESQISRTSSRDSRALAACSIRLSRIFDGFMSGAAASTASTSPKSWISLDAVLGPMPGTPGTLSTLSPISASTSPTFSGGTPNFSITCSRPMRRSFIVSSMSRPPWPAPGSSISCIRSLSELTIVTCQPALSAATE